MKEVEYIQCPFCGWVRPRRFFLPSLKIRADHYEEREFKFTGVDPANVMVWQKKLVGKARGAKGGTIELIEGLKLGELPDDLKVQVRAQCERILSLLGEANVEE